MAQAKVLNEKEIRKVLLYIASKKHSSRNRCMFLMTTNCGMRVGEVAALRICDVLGADGSVMDEIALAASQTKGNHSRTVLVPKKLQEELTDYLQQRFGLKDLLAVTLTDTQRALFPTQKNPKRGFTANTLCQLFHKIYKDARMTGATSHSGRRTFITKLADKGVGGILAPSERLGGGCAPTTGCDGRANVDDLSRADAAQIVPVMHVYTTIYTSSTFPIRYLRPSPCGSPAAARNGRP